MKAQIFMQKQSQQQAIEQGVSHDILYQLLATAECYALGKKGQRHFKGYELFNSSSKSKPDLRNQLIIQAETFKNSYNFFDYDYKNAGGYEFPQNLPRDKIIKLLNYWKSVVANEDKIIYDNIINFFEGKPSLPYPKYDNSNFTTREDVSDVQMGNLMTAMNYINHSNDSLAENIKKEYKERGHYKGNVRFDAENPVDPAFNIIHGDLRKPNSNVKYYPSVKDNYQ